MAGSATSVVWFRGNWFGWLVKAVLVGALFVFMVCIPASAQTGPGVVSLTSLTHPNESSWYSFNDALFTWDWGPSIAGAYDAPSNTRGVFIEGSLAYLADGYDGLKIVDITDPTDPTLVGSLDTDSYAFNVVVSGSYAYVANGLTGLKIINISNPTSPVLTGTYDTPGNATDVAVSGIFAYVADETQGLRIVGVYNPASPYSAGVCDTSGFATGVALSGSYAYVADGDSGLQVVNVSNVTAPVIVGSYNTLGSSQDVTISGSYAYVADWTYGLQIINIFNPAGPSLTGTYNTPCLAGGVAVSGGYAFVADGDCGMQAINVSNPASPVLHKTCDTPGSAAGVAVSGDHAYIADNSGGLQVIKDLYNPTVPSTVGSLDTNGYAVGVAVSGDYAYIADMSPGIKIMNISNVASPTLAGSLNTPGDSWDVAVSGDYAYVADSYGGFAIIDASDPASPTLASSDSTYGSVGVTVSGNYMYLAAANNGLLIFDVTDPANPALAGSLDVPGDGAWDVAVSGSYAYVVDRFSGLSIVNVSNPSRPSLLGSYDTPGESYSVAKSGDHAYVCDYNYGLYIVNVTNPMSPVLAGSYGTTTAYGMNVAIADGFAYVAAQTGLLKINVSNPAAPVLATSVGTPAQARGVAVAGGHAFVAADSAGLQIIDTDAFYSYTIDQTPDTVPDIIPEGSSSSAAFTDLTDGEWYFHVSMANTAGEWGPASHRRIRIDTTPPIVSDVLPTGMGSDSSTYISAHFADVGSGVDPAATVVTLDGTPLTGCVKASTDVACQVSGLSPGSHTIGGSVDDNTGASSPISGSFTVCRDYDWTWYDNIYMQNWVLAANPVDASGPIDIHLAIGGTHQNLDPFAIAGSPGGQIPAGKTMTPIFSGLIGGPVEVESLSGAPAIVSQRSLMGNSFEEVPGVESGKLSDHFYWTWYDQSSPGYSDWILIANPGTEKVKTEIYIDGQLMQNNIPGRPDSGQDYYEIEPGENVTPAFPGVMGGPVEVKAYKATGTWPADARDVIASQRVLSNWGTAFNEMPGIPAAELSDDYLWTWYDQKATGFSDWVLVANPSGTTVTYQVLIDRIPMNLGIFGNPGDATTGTLAAGEIDTPFFPGMQDGPVEVIATGGNVIASQRIVAGPSFGEVAGYRVSALTSDYHWTWYDQLSPGSQNWVLIANPNATPVIYDVKIAGEIVTPGTNIIDPYGIVAPTFPGMRDGPVEVTASGGNVMVSQRVLWNGYFNEVLGTVLP